MAISSGEYGAPKYRKASSKKTKKVRSKTKTVSAIKPRRRGRR